MVLNPTRSCPMCGGTMIREVAMWFHGWRWFCIKCFYSENEPVQYRTWTSDNTSVEGNDSTEDWREEWNHK
jgi:ribosomal protein S27AE